MLQNAAAYGSEIAAYGSTDIAATYASGIAAYASTDRRLLTLDNARPI